jgi:hypothetical protein
MEEVMVVLDYCQALIQAHQALSGMGTDLHPTNPHAALAAMLDLM